MLKTTQLNLTIGHTYLYTQYLPRYLVRGDPTVDQGEGGMFFLQKNYLVSN